MYWDRVNRKLRTKLNRSWFFKEWNNLLIVISFRKSSCLLWSACNVINSILAKFVIYSSKSVKMGRLTKMVLSKQVKNSDWTMRNGNKSLISWTLRVLDRLIIISSLQQLLTIRNWLQSRSLIKHSISLIQNKKAELIFKTFKMLFHQDTPEPHSCQERE